MAHPRMYDDADPALTRLRPLALAFPEAVEVEAWGRPTFRAGRKIFAVYGVTDDFPQALVFKPDPDERPALVGDARFFAPPYFGPGGWLALDLAVHDADWDEVRELLDSSYRQVALVRMVRALDAASADGAASPVPDDAAPPAAPSTPTTTPSTTAPHPAQEPS
ncbi:MmcQ/YjbR family DNA-binding protein [Cellulomonas sp. ATA003]|uniref:MmcQ/YjbR family DNA-binding protein n=1 Tax=Cellulomonas sp. ATA003 TaxID=3073064 RepID=UPI00287347C0|nr:MmcQ/YjbR family DNA-binding protein [Cellulomonas sp. ATA003]WNB85161.1 MmcQ/YjbR family DNA-binding protein [Cellulomonas sp. ATA003]